ncbi:MAG: hypothetical protein ACRDTD_32475, partial [Pseudonocardiaceae bacterium]
LVLSIGTAAMAVLAITTVLVLGPAAGRPPTAELLRTVLGGGLYLTVIALTSLSVGALVRHSAGAISTMIGLVLLPSLMGLFAPGEKIGYYLLTYAPVSISASLIGQGIDPHSNNGWQMLGVLTLITAALLGIAYPPVAKRDV